MIMNDLKKFGIWFRNGSCFCITWLLIIVLACCFILQVDVIRIDFLIKMVVASVGGVFIFCFFFQRFFIKKWSFEQRLTGFIITIGIYECLAFYWSELFRKNGSLLQWILFFLYSVSLTIYKFYCKKRGTLYTEALQEYKKKLNH